MILGVWKVEFGSFLPKIRPLSGFQPNAPSISSAKKKGGSFSALTRPKIPMEGPFSAGLNLLVTWTHVYHSTAGYYAFLITENSNFFLLFWLLNSKSCYCFSIQTGSACRGCWNKGQSLSSFNLSLSMPGRRKKIEEEERWKFWNKPFLLHKSDI